MIRFRLAILFRLNVNNLAASDDTKNVMISLDVLCISQTKQQPTQIGKRNIRIGFAAENSLEELLPLRPDCLTSRSLSSSVQREWYIPLLATALPATPVLVLD